jgi:glycerophosphoryl diester phosphodiesterase
MTKAPLVQLIDAVGKPYDFAVAHDPRTYADLASAQGLREISRYADGVGPNSAWIVPIDPATGRTQAPTRFIQNAHEAGLLVHPWTFRRENNFLPVDYRQGNPASPQFLNATGDIARWMTLFYKLGVDGLFTDNSDAGVAVRETVFGR